MNSHINARTTPYARTRMVARYDAGVLVREIAAAFEVSERTVFNWRARFRAEGEAGFANRSRLPLRST
ncbi:helix-turn-helix domain-containing protein [Stappia sp.]|uniref:helix-turn-helix domain-containing protein n=1 Tax=Stappia sp. TaxID=1870903 RepID=UPI003C7BEA6F